jgi:hypothetical protein
MIAARPRAAQKCDAHVRPNATSEHGHRAGDVRRSNHNRLAGRNERQYFDTLRSIFPSENEVRSLLNHEIFVTMNQKRAISVLGALYPGIVGCTRGWFAPVGAAATS